MWNRKSPTISINKDITVISDSRPPNVNEDSQKRTQCLRSSRCHQPSQWLLRSWGWGDVINQKDRTLAPDSWDVCERNDFDNPRLLHFPRHRRALNSLTWYLIFLTKTYDVQTACLFCCKPVYSLTLSSAFSKQSPTATWNAISRAWSPNIPTK